MVQPLDRRKESPSQTAGPYVHIGLMPNFSGIKGVYSEDLGARLVEDGVKGERIKVTGKIFDGTGAAVKDALLEVWHADAEGLYNSPAEPRGQADPRCRGWGRIAADMSDGTYLFDTIKPGPVPHPSGVAQAPHITFWIVARGINLGLHTRMYFGDESDKNSADPILSRIEHKDRVSTLVAKRTGNTYHFDIRLQGEGETIFFDI